MGREDVRADYGTANSHFLDDQILVDGRCIAFASQPWTDRILLALSPALNNRHSPACAMLEDPNYGKCSCRPTPSADEIVERSAQVAENWAGGCGPGKHIATEIRKLKGEG